METSQGEVWRGIQSVNHCQMRCLGIRLEPLVMTKLTAVSLSVKAPYPVLLDETGTKFGCPAGTVDLLDKSKA